MDISPEQLEYVGRAVRSYHRQKAGKSAKKRERLLWELTTWAVRQAWNLRNKAEDSHDRRIMQIRGKNFFETMEKKISHKFLDDWFHWFDGQTGQRVLYVWSYAIMELFLKEKQAGLSRTYPSEHPRLRYGWMKTSWSQCFPHREMAEDLPDPFRRRLVMELLMEEADYHFLDWQMLQSGIAQEVKKRAPAQESETPGVDAFELTENEAPWVPPEEPEVVTPEEEPVQLVLV